MIVFEHVSAGYGDKLALSDMSLKFPETGCVALLGASGIGKTTVLRLLAGLQKPISGRISGIEKKESLMMFQEDRLLPWRTALCNVSLAAPSGVDCERVLRELEISDVRQYPGEMSGGMRRRVALARALSRPTDLLLLDEPFTGMDEPLRARIAPIVRRAAPLIIFTTHELGDIALMCASAITLGSTTTNEISEKTQEITETPCEKRGKVR